MIAQTNGAVEPGNESRSRRDRISETERARPY